MPVAHAISFSGMIHAAREGTFAYPAFNIHDLFTADAVIEGFAKAESNGIVQIFPTAAAAATGLLSDPFCGAITLAEHIVRVADHYNIQIALHTDHCDSACAPAFLDPLIDLSAANVTNGGSPLFTSHMFDGSALALAENLILSEHYLKRCKASNLWLEIETGIVGLEYSTTKEQTVFTTPEDFIAIRQTLGKPMVPGYLVAPAFGNVHGVYRPGEVQLQPDVLGRAQQALRGAFGEDFNLVFHGGSGSSDEEIREAISHGVVKMNFDTDGQYVFSRAVAHHFYTGYDKVLRIDGDPGDKLSYFTETWLGKGREALSDYVAATCQRLGSAGSSRGNG